MAARMQLCGGKTNMANPEITVLVPVYNGENFLRESIESILSQTFTDFELLIIDDGSTDSSAAIVRSYKDTRIRFVQNPANLGLIKTLNKGLGLANGNFLARMDADDISFPERLEKQIAFMKENIDIGVCGTQTRVISTDHITMHPTDPDMIKAYLFFKCVLSHPSVMINCKLLKKYNLLYDENYIHAEDFEFWQRCSLYFKIANLPDILLYYRITPSSICSFHHDKQTQTRHKICHDILIRNGFSFSQEELNIQYKISDDILPETNEDIQKLGYWLEKLQKENSEKKIYPIKAFNKVLASIWIKSCLNKSKSHLWTFNSLIKSPKLTLFAFSFKKAFKLIAKH